MSKISSFRAIIDLWPIRSDFAREIGATIEQARKWDERDSIPVDWWVDLLELDRVRDAGITAGLLTRLASKHNTSPITRLRTVEAPL